MDRSGYSSRSTIMLALGFLILVGMVLIALWQSVLQESAAERIRHTIEVENQLAQVGRFVTQAESASRGYVITRRPGALTAFHESRDQLDPAIDHLANLIRDNPEQQANVAELRDLADKRVALLNQIVEDVDNGRLEAAIEGVGSNARRDYALRFSAVLDRMFGAEAKLLTQRQEIANRRTKLTRITLLASGALILIFAVLTIRASRARLRALSDTVAELQVQSDARGRAQEQVQQLQKMETIGQLTGGIAHDFNNMLAIIVGSLDLARRRLKANDSQGIATCLDNAHEGADRAAALTAQLLAFARRQPLEPRVLEPNRAVSDMSEMLRRTLGEEVKIETVLAGGLWQVHADPEQLKSAIVNLAVNARDAMPGGGKLTIETANSELDDHYARQHNEVTPGQYVMFSITDTGAGMTPEVVAQAFEPFFTTKDVGKGTGLGLSQVFGFVKQSRGHVKIYSEPGQGTTVKIYLPRFTGPSPVTIAKQQTDDLEPGQTEELILVVEDESRVRRMTVDTLLDLGYSVIEAPDGTAALSLLSSHPDIRLLFTDIVMPGMSGRALADSAVAQRPDLKILYTTGYTRNAIVHNGMVDYGVAFLQKPFTIRALARKVREVLDEA